MTIGIPERFFCQLGHAVVAAAQLDYALACLAAYMRNEDDDYVMITMAKVGGPTTAVEQALTKWPPDDPGTVAVRAFFERAKSALAARHKQVHSLTLLDSNGTPGEPMPLVRLWARGGAHLEPLPTVEEMADTSRELDLLSVLAMTAQNAAADYVRTNGVSK